MPCNYTTQSSVTKAPKKYNDPKPTKSQIDEVIQWVKRSTKTLIRDVAMIVGGAAITAALATGLIVESGDCLVPVEELTQAIETVEVKPVQDELDRQIEKGKESADPTYRLNSLILEECIGNGWWDKLIQEDEQDMRERIPHIQRSPWPQFPNLELKNSDSAKTYGYLVYVGSRQDCVLAWGDCIDLELICSCKPNGKTGSWKLIISLIENQSLQNLAA